MTTLVDLVSSVRHERGWDMKGEEGFCFFVFLFFFFMTRVLESCRDRGLVVGL